jgi:hypothetical protein
MKEKEHKKQQKPVGCGESKVMIRLFLCPPRRLVGKWRNSSSLLTSALIGGEWSASHSSCFIPRVKVTDIRQIEGWLGPRNGLDALEERHIFSHTGNQTLVPQTSNL